MTAFKNLTCDEMRVTNNIYLNGNSGINNDVIINQGGAPYWANIFNRAAKYVDTTDSSQDLNADININFDTEIYNNANISFGGDFFRISDEGYYSITFECLLSNDQAQTMISFFVNGTQEYGNIAYYNNNSASPTQVGYTMSSVLFFNSGDQLRVFGQKITSGPNYLLKNPIY